jgi:uncharacterized protein YecT (DUF1311 family)
MRFRTLIVLQVLGAVAAAAGAQAQSAGADCMDKATSTVEMNVCLDRLLKRADAELNAAYQSAMKYIDASEDVPAEAKGKWRGALRDAQRGWIAFRDADCKGAVPFEWFGGTGATAAALDCMLEKTRARTKELTERYQDK